MNSNFHSKNLNYVTDCCPIRLQPMRMGLWGLFVVAFGMLVGCGTTTTRIATEQLLMSDAVDRAIAAIDFRSLEGEKVYVASVGRATSEEWMKRSIGGVRRILGYAPLTATQLLVN